jgi:tetratricopeptide (TPR) repeat protein
MTIGDEPEYFQTLDEFRNIVKKADPSGLEFKYEKMHGENHRTVPHLSIYNGLSFIFSDWQLTPETFIAGVPAIDKHYKMISEKYGYEISTPEYTLNALGYYYLNKDEMDKALAVFSENIDRFPESANVYDSYGEALEIDNKYEMAEVNYANAVRIAKKENHPNIDIYTKNLERIKGKLAFK